MIVTGDNHHRGLSVRPSASDLVRDFANGLPTGLNSNPTQLAPQLIDGLTNSLELIDSGTEEVFPTENRVVIRLTNPYFLHLDGFDNPIVSFIGTGLAAGLDTPIDLRVRPSTEDEIGDYVLTCDW